MNKPLHLLFCLLAFTTYSQECVERIVSSDNMITVFLTDETIYTWGFNQFGQLGNGTTVSQNTPAPTVNATLWSDISHARMHTIALQPNGTVWAWGNNELGQLGDGTIITRLEPVQVGTDSDWVTISGGNLHSVGLKADGTLWGWGNSAGQELINSDTYYTSPIQISADTDWALIQAGYFRTFGIKTNGTLWGRGRNLYGAVGVGNGGAVISFTQIGTATDWAKVSGARSNHTLALKTDGTLWGWGLNENGVIGDGTSTNRLTPIQIGSDLWKDVSAGNFHSLGIKMDGTLWQWGSYGYIEGGFLIPNSSVPVQVGTDTDWKIVSAGYCSSHAVKEDNSLWGWGYNGGGWLGDGNTVSLANPALIMECEALSTGDFNTAAFMIYPNPAKDVLHWTAIDDLEKYEVFNSLGQSVKSGDNLVNQVTLSNLSTGLYFAVFHTTDGKKQVRKFLKD